MSTLKVGDTVALNRDKTAWYSEYGLNPKMVIAAGELGTVTAVNVPVVRKVEKRNSYHVARFGNKMVDFNAGEYVRVS
jgi:hypothetical protein